MNRLSLTLSTFTAALLAVAGTAVAGTPIDERRAMDANGLVMLDLMNATVRITAGNSAEFHISGELGDDAEEYELRATDGSIHFEEDISSRDNDWNWNWGCWRSNDEDCDRDSGQRFSDLDIELPAGSVLRLDGINGDVSITGLTNSTNVSIVNGDLRISAVSGTIKAETVNGSLDTEKLQGRVSLETVNGEISDRDSTVERIDFSTVNGDVFSNVRSPKVGAEAVNGDIDLQLDTVEELDLSTVGGRIEVDTSLADNADVEISSVHGRINLTVPTSESARFIVNTEVNGRISNQLTADEPERENRYVNSSSLGFTLNGGSADVEITTVSGDVTLRGK